PQHALQPRPARAAAARDERQAPVVAAQDVEDPARVLERPVVQQPRGLVLHAHRGLLVAELQELLLAVRPVLPDLDPEVEVDGDPVERLELEPGGASRPLEQLAALPDDDALLALALLPDQRADGEPVLVAL